MKINMYRIMMMEASMENMKNMSVPIKVAVAMAMNKAQIEPIVVTFNSSRAQLFADYGIELPDGKIEIPLDSDDGVSKMEELLTLEVDVDIKKVNIEDFGDISIPLNLLDGLMPMIEVA